MSETPTSPATPAFKRTGRGIKIALAISLAANLLIVGLVAGAVLGFDRRTHDGGQGGPGLRALGLAPFALALDREDRDALRNRLERSDLHAHRASIARGMRDLQAVLRSEPFDRSAAESALASARGAVTALQAQGHAALVDQLDAMGPEARLDLANRMARAMRRFGGGGVRPPDGADR